jgi:hypothetical protein
VHCNKYVAGLAMLNSKEATDIERGHYRKTHTNSRRIIYEVRRLVASFRQAIFSNAFLNAFWNAFSKPFTSSEAPTCSAIVTKRLWRSASVSLGLASDLRVMLRNPVRAGKVVA